MARKITLVLSDELEAKIKAEAEVAGQSVEDCVMLILMDAVEVAPPILSDERLKDELRKGLASPMSDWTEADKERAKADLLARHLRSKAG
jgi:hypothetical protein